MLKHLLIVALIFATPAYAERAPSSLATDNRMKQVMYDKNQVYHIQGVYGYQTSIEFAEDESIKAVSLGDTIAWQVIPVGNRVFLKPVEPNADTNLTIVTNGRTYYFRLSSLETKNRADMTYLLRFAYPQPLPKLPSTAEKKVVKGFSITDLNMDYSSYGNDTAKDGIRLKRVFDDGQFTFFKFEDGSEIPAIYTVGADGTESMVNKRREGDYFVVERLAGRYTLRNGTLYLCVRNDDKSARAAVQER